MKMTIRKGKMNKREDEKLGKFMVTHFFYLVYKKSL